MHFALPSTDERENAKGKYTVYNIHVNGVYHCAARYSELERLQSKLREDYPEKVFPKFPPKKLFSLTLEQIEERRSMIEGFLQAAGEDPVINKGSTFKNFLIESQEDLRQRGYVVDFCIRLPDNSDIHVKALSVDRTEKVMIVLADVLELNPALAKYFSLYLEVDDEKLIDEEGNKHRYLLRRIQSFESPHYALEKSKRVNGKLVLRSSFWSKELFQSLLMDEKAVHLLYTQALLDANNGWIRISDDVKEKLTDLKRKKKRKEFVEVISQLETYGYIVLDECKSDYPKPNSIVTFSIGANDMRLVLKKEAAVNETVFRIRRTRCWKLTAKDDEMEFSFDYLFGKNDLRWVKISSKQAIFLSMCIQTAVEELIDKPILPVLVENPAFEEKRKQHQAFLSSYPTTAPISVDDETPSISPSPKGALGKGSSSGSDSASSYSAVSTPTTPATEDLPVSPSKSAEKPHQKEVAKASENLTSSKLSKHEVGTTTSAGASSSSVSKAASSSSSSSKPVESKSSTVTENAVSSSSGSSSSLPDAASEAKLSAPSNSESSVSAKKTASKTESKPDANSAKPSSDIISSPTDTSSGRRNQAISSPASTSASSPIARSTSDDENFTVVRKPKKTFKAGALLNSIKAVGKPKSIDNVIYDGSIGDDDL